MATIVVAGCSQDIEPGPPIDDSAGGELTLLQKQYVIGMSQCNLGEPWRVQMNEDIRRAADRHDNLKVIFKTLKMTR